MLILFPDIMTKVPKGLSFMHGVSTNNQHLIDTKEEDLIHSEDIAHFAKHDRLEDEAIKQAREDAMPIVEHNIPAKFRRPS